MRKSALERRKVDEDGGEGQPGHESGELPARPLTSTQQSTDTGPTRLGLSEQSRDEDGGAEVRGSHQR